MSTNEETITISKVEYMALHARAFFAEGALLGISYRLKSIIREEAPHTNCREKLIKASEDAEALSKAISRVEKVES